jgi:hypothetical protein
VVHIQPPNQSGSFVEWRSSLPALKVVYPLADSEDETSQSYEDRALHRHLAASPDVLRTSWPAGRAGRDPHKGYAVAVLRVDIGLHLEDEAGDLWVFGARSAAAHWPLGPAVAAALGLLADPAQQLAHPEIVECAAEIDRGQMALAISQRVERRA